MLFILLAALLLFGGDKLPEVARGLGKGIRQFQDASDEVKREIHKNINEVKANIEESIDQETSVEQTPPIEKDSSSLK
ncbi:MAG: twin-arginine translocase TatA/TatE family subunit [Sphingobacteriaceae bacterium]|nr:twin-arginine translocase TatA/TatE family subunit [Sphingobacteriaceae bacterium]